MSIPHQILGQLTFRRVIVALVVLVVFAGGLLVLRATGGNFSSAEIRAILAQLGPWGPLALIAILAAVLIIPVVPAGVLQIGAGLAFGPLPGLLYVLIADFIGASAGYWLARRWGKSLINRWLTPETQATLARLTRRINWRSVMLLRLLPGPAYPLISFAAGYAPLGFLAYTVSSLLGVLPSLALLVLAGDTVTSSPWLASGIVVALVGGMALLGRMLQTADSAT